MRDSPPSDAATEPRHPTWRASLGRLPFWLGLLALLLLQALYGYQHVLASLDAHWFNDDARQQIWPMLRFRDPGLFPGDYVADYYLDAFLPAGYKLLYQWLALVADPRAVSKVLPYLLHAGMLAAMAAAAWRLGGPGVAWASVALLIIAHVYLAMMSGGLPRTFGYPLAALLILGLVRARPLLLAGVTVAGGAFYYVVAALGGASLFVFLFLIPAAWRGTARDWSWRRRLALLAGTALVAGGLFLPAWQAGQAYGPALSMADVAVYPEAGRGGRYSDDDLPILDEPLDRALAAAGMGFGGRKRLTGPAAVIAPAVVLLVLVLGLAPLARGSLAVRRFLLLPPLAVAGYFAAWLFSPYLFLPTRYLDYILPLFMAIALPLVVAGILSRWRRPPMRLAAVAVPAVVLLLCGGPGERRGLMHAPDSGVYPRIAALPRDALVAGWPGGMVQDVPYLSARSVLISAETHQAFHAAYVLEMRARMQAVTAACFSLDRTALRQLRDRHGVSHLLIERGYWRKRPAYFRPFGRVPEGIPRGELESRLEGMAHAIIHAEGDAVLLDLARVSATPPASRLARRDVGGRGFPIPERHIRSNLI